MEVIQFLISISFFFKQISQKNKNFNMDTDQVIDFKGETLMEVILIDYRWVIVCFLLLPMSFLYNLWFYVRNIIIFHMNSAPRTHDEKVRRIQRQVIRNLFKKNISNSMRNFF